MTTHLSLNRTPQPVLRFEPPAPTPSSRSELGKAPANTVGDTANTSLPTLKMELGEKQNLQVLGQQLAQIAKNLGVNAGPVAVASALTTTRMPVDADSALAATAGDSMTLAAYIQSMGLPQPTNHFTLTGLAKAVSHRAMEHPLGNLSGALSWPVPLSPNSQVRLRNHAMDYVQRNEEKTSGTQVKAGILDFLRDRHPLPGQIGSDPKKALDALLSSPEAQRMGKHLQEKMQGLANHSSATDYLLAAIATQMDPESINTPHRHKLAGFDLASPEFFGQPASVVVERLSQHLSSEGRVSRDMASTAARLLLTAHTPALLVKHIPDKITYGSPAWVNLTVAVMTIEAQTPGKTANMTFGEVMLEARSASVADPAVTERAQRDALLDWGVANGVLTSKADEAYTSDELNTLVSQYRARTTKMLEASVALDAPVPSRKDLALAELKKRFGDLGDLFEERLIDVRSRVYWLDDGNSYDSDSANPHSLLDVAMMDLADPYVSYSSKDSRIPIAALNANPRFGVSEDFKQQFDQVIDDKKTAIATYVKHMISQLPLADRKNFEYDDLNLYLRKFGKDYENTTKLLVQTERAAKATAYEIDFNAGVIRKTYPAGGHRRTGSKLPVDPNATLKFVPTGSQAFQNKDRPLHETPPDSFASTRTQLIADAFVNHLDLDHPDIKAQALGLTTRDKHEKKVEAVKEFFLNLIPLRSAIVNFQQGNYGAGLVDLGLDIFGFVSAGASASSKVMKISGRAWSAAYKSARIAKTIGVTTIGVLNPLSGVGDVVKGGTRLAATGIGMLRTQGIDYVNKLRGATGTYDLLKATSKQYDLAATGTY